MQQTIYAHQKDIYITTRNKIEIAATNLAYLDRFHCVSSAVEESI
jgi:hypothetical protein